MEWKRNANFKIDENVDPKSQMTNGGVRKSRSSGSLNILPTALKWSKKNDTGNFDFSTLPGDFKPIKSCLSNSDLASLGLVEKLQGDIVESSLKTPNSMKRSVSFSKIEIREHPRTLGGIVGSGPALSLDWYVEDQGSDSDEDKPRCKTVELSVEEYEKSRDIFRDSTPSALSKKRRKQLLKEFGFSKEQIKQAQAQLESEMAAKVKDEKKNFMGKMKRLIKTDDTKAELNELMKKAAEAERIRKLQMEKYLQEQRKKLLASCDNQILEGCGMDADYMQEQRQKLLQKCVGEIMAQQAQQSVTTAKTERNKDSGDAETSDESSSFSANGSSAPPSEEFAFSF